MAKSRFGPRGVRSVGQQHYYTNVHHRHHRHHVLRRDGEGGGGTNSATSGSYSLAAHHLKELPTGTVLLTRMARCHGCARPSSTADGRLGDNGVICHNTICQRFFCYKCFKVMEDVTARLLRCSIPNWCPICCYQKSRAIGIPTSAWHIRFPTTDSVNFLHELRKALGDFYTTDMIIYESTADLPAMLRYQGPLHLKKRTIDIVHEKGFFEARLKLIRLLSKALPLSQKEGSKRSMGEDDDDEEEEEEDDDDDDSESLSSSLSSTSSDSDCSVSEVRQNNGKSRKHAPPSSSSAEQLGQSKGSVLQSHSIYHPQQPESNPEQHPPRVQSNTTSLPDFSKLRSYLFTELKPPPQPPPQPPPHTPPPHTPPLQELHPSLPKLLSFLDIYNDDPLLIKRQNLLIASKCLSSLESAMEAGRAYYHPTCEEVLLLLQVTHRTIIESRAQAAEQQYTPHWINLPELPQQQQQQQQQQQEQRRQQRQSIYSRPPSLYSQSSSLQQQHSPTQYPSTREYPPLYNVRASSTSTAAAVTQSNSNYGVTQSNSNYGSFNSSVSGGQQQQQQQQQHYTDQKLLNRSISRQLLQSVLPSSSSSLHGVSSSQPVHSSQFVPVDGPPPHYSSLLRNNSSFNRSSERQLDSPSHHSQQSLYFGVGADTYYNNTRHQPQQQQQSHDSFAGSSSDKPHPNTSQQSDPTATIDRFNSNATVTPSIQKTTHHHLYRPISSASTATTTTCAYNDSVNNNHQRHSPRPISSTPTQNILPSLTQQQQPISMINLYGGDPIVKSSNGGGGDLLLTTNTKTIVTSTPPAFVVVPPHRQQSSSHYPLQQIGVED